MTEQKTNLKPLYEGPDSTMLSWNGTCPESPNGERITYFKMPCPVDDGNETALTGEIWVCDWDLSNHRKICEVDIKCKGFLHNGAQAQWIDDQRLAFRGTDGGLFETIYVVDTESGEQLLTPIAGRIGHYAVNQTVPFTITPEQVPLNPTYKNIDEPGFYALDCNSGTVKKILSKEVIDAHLRSLGYTPRENDPGDHLMFNFDMSRVMARYLFQGQERYKENTIVSCDTSDGGNLIVFLPPDERPLHQLWFDNETYFGVYNKRRDRICRWQQDGTMLETLAGPGNHIDASPDRNWFAGDTKGFSDCPPLRIQLFRRGETEPVAVLARQEFGPNLRGHANPVFSRDGRRVYFNQRVSYTKLLAYYADISSIVHA